MKNNPLPPHNPADFAHLDDEALEALAWHDIPVRKLSKLCDPLSCWIEVEKPIVKAEIQACIDEGRAAPMETPLWTELAFGKTGITIEENRDRHIRKIAWFVLNPSSDPISLEVGCQALGVMAHHLIEDGNHRFAAAVFRKDKTVRAKIGGGVKDAQEEGLWCPNGHEQEMGRRQMAAFNLSRKRKSSP